MKIGGHNILITHNTDEENDGYFETSTNEINIAPNLPKTRAGVTLIHEIIHAVNPTLDENPFGHALLASIAEQIYQVLEDNKFLSDNFYETCVHVVKEK